MKRLIVVAALALAGCASGMVPMKNDPVDPRWPLLKTSYWFGKPAAVVKACYDAVPLGYKLIGGVATGCAYIDWNAMTCGINVMYGDYATLGHELAHCYGARHIAEDTWQSWESHLFTVFGGDPKIKAFYYVRAKDGRTQGVTREGDGLRYQVIE